MSETTQEIDLISIQRLSTEVGVEFFGVGPLDYEIDSNRFRAWVDEGRHAGMKYLENHKDLRRNAQHLLPGANAVLSFGFSYNIGDRWNGHKSVKHPRIAMYARLRDYHKFLRQKLDYIASQAFSQRGQKDSYRVCVDTAPILERAVARMTSEGFIGKNTCFIHPKKGSFFLLGEIITTFCAPDLAKTPLQPNTAIKTYDPSVRDPELGGCGTCRRCQVHCPTGALDKDFQIDARKCLSWWTIENRDEIPDTFWPWLSSYYFGCDICQLVCPYNRAIEVNPELQSLTKIKESFSLYDIATMTEAKYLEWFAGTPMTRAKREGLIRNALIALYQINDSRLLDALNVLKDEPHETVKKTRQKILLKMTLAN